MLDQSASPSKQVVIVGMGPGGLAAAINAAIKGYKVHILDNRDYFTRSQTIALDEDSMQILKELILKSLDFSLASGVLEKEECSSLEEYVDKFIDRIKRKLVSISDIQEFLHEFCPGTVKQLKGSDYVIEGFDLSKSQKLLRVKYHNEVLEIPFDHFLAADGAKRTMAGKLNLAAGEKIKHLPLEIQARQVAHGVVNLRSKKDLNGRPLRLIPHDRELNEEDLFKLAALGWKEPYFPSLGFHPNKDYTVFHLSSEVPESFLALEDPIKTQKLLEWSKLLCKLKFDFDEVELNLSGRRSESDKMKATVFQVNLSYAVTPFVDLEGATYSTLGDAASTPYFFFGHGVGDALADADDWSRCLPDLRDPKADHNFFESKKYIEARRKRTENIADRLYARYEADRKLYIELGVGKMESMMAYGRNLLELTRYYKDKERFKGLNLKEPRDKLEKAIWSLAGYTRVTTYESLDVLPSFSDRDIWEIYLIKNKDNTQCFAHYFDGKKWCVSGNSDLSMISSMLEKSPIEKEKTVKQIAFLCGIPNLGVYDFDLYDEAEPKEAGSLTEEEQEKEQEKIEAFQLIKKLFGFDKENSNSLPSSHHADLGQLRSRQSREESPILPSLDELYQSSCECIDAIYEAEKIIHQDSKLAMLQRELDVILKAKEEVMSEIIDGLMNPLAKALQDRTLKQYQLQEARVRSEINAILKKIENIHGGGLKDKPILFHGYSKRLKKLINAGRKDPDKVKTVQDVQSSKELEASHLQHVIMSEPDPALLKRVDMPEELREYLALPEPYKYAAAGNNKALFSAVSLKKLESVNILMKNPGVQMALALDKENIILNAAASKGYLDELKAIIEVLPEGARIVAANANTTLKIAAENGHLPVVKYLLSIPEVASQPSTLMQIKQIARDHLDIVNELDSKLQTADPKKNLKNN